MNLRQLNQPGEPSNEQSCGDKVKDYWNQIPLFVKIIIISSTCLYILSWISQGFVMTFANIPKITVQSYHLWTIITTVFINLSIINLLFVFFAWIPDAVKLEQANGTIKYMINFFTNAIIIQIIFTLSCYLIALGFPQVLNYPSAGLWPLALAEITILCLANPESPLRMFLIPCPIKAKYYPWALFGFFTILSGFTVIQFDILAGIVYGHMFFYWLKDKIQCSDNFVMKIQGCCLFAKCASLNGNYKLINKY